MTIKELTKSAVGVSRFYITNNGTEAGSSFQLDYDPYNQLHVATMGNAAVHHFEPFYYNDYPFPNDEYSIGMEIVVEA